MNSISHSEPALGAHSRSTIGRKIRIGLLLIGAAALVALALFVRVMNEPLSHDEHIYMGAGTLFGQHTLYQEVSYGHLPNLPILLHFVLDNAFGGYKFLTARFLIFLCWIALLSALAALSWRLTRSLSVTGLASLLLVTNPLFVSKSGMLVAVHLFPVCFATLAFLSFVLAVDDGRRRSLYAFVCGLFLSLAVGFKANYVFTILPFVIAAHLLPSSLTVRERLLRVVLPMGIGGILGGLPTFYYLVAHTDVFIFNVLDYFVGPHRSYWSEPANAATVTGLSLPSRIVFGYRQWGTGVTVVIILGVIYCFAVFAMARDPAPNLRRIRSYPVLIALGLTVLGVLISFVVRPSFPQYFMPPITFAILLLVSLIGAMAEEQRRGAQPLVAALAASTVLLGAPQLLQDLPKLASPSKWAAVQVHDNAIRIRRHLSVEQSTPRLATLVPIYGIEAGLDLYPELASGPFFYRIGDYLTAEERRAYRVTSPSTIHRLFDADPPDAILVGHEGELDKPLEDFAKANAYRRVADPVGGDRYGESVLYVRSDPSGRPDVATESDER